MVDINAIIRLINYKNRLEQDQQRGQGAEATSTPRALAVGIPVNYGLHTFK